VLSPKRGFRRREAFTFISYKNVTIFYDCKDCSDSLAADSYLFIVDSGKGMKHASQIRKPHGSVRRVGE
jgi:hypothetical protein